MWLNLFHLKLAWLTSKRCCLNLISDEEGERSVLSKPAEEEWWEEICSLRCTKHNQNL